MNPAARATRWLASPALFFVFAAGGAVAASGADSPFTLRPGVVVDPARGSLYLATPEGGIEAVAIAGGRSQWKSDAAAVPLALVDRWLVAQSEGAEEGVLPIVVLDAGGGQRLSAARIALPDGVSASVSDTVTRSFRVTAREASGGVLISWSQTELPERGSVPEEPSGVRVKSGTVLLDPRSGRIASAAGAMAAPRQMLPPGLALKLGIKSSEQGPWRSGSVYAAVGGGHGDAVTLRRWDTLSGQALVERTISEKAVAVLPSGDERYLVASEHVATDDLTEPQYRWVIASLETGERVGVFRRDASAAPFFVSGGQIVVQSQPHGERGSDGEWVEDPLEIRTLGLTSGDVQWKRAVRDFEYRGVQPPGLIKKNPAPKKSMPAPKKPKKGSPASASIRGLSLPAGSSPGLALPSAGRRGGESAKEEEEEDTRPRLVPSLEAEPAAAPPVDLPSPPSLASIGGAWVFQGPSPTINGQAEGITNRPVIGSIQSIVAHPANPDILWVGATNGGIWKTINATNASPTWTPLTDAFGSLSIGVLRLDPTDVTNNTLVAGLGRFSSFSFSGGSRFGLLRTTNGGSNWTALPAAGVAGTLVGKNIVGVAARGATIVVAANTADTNSCSNIGIFRSVDTGANFTKISSASSLGASGLPGGGAYDLASDPTSNAVLYTAVRDAAICTTSGVNGVYKSVDTGATWTKVSDAVMDALMTDVLIGNVKLAVGNSGQVYAGLINGGKLAGLFRSGTGGASWTQLDTPSTNEGGTAFGIQPDDDDPGSQGSIHFSLVADQTNVNIVYLGGDRQPGNGDGTASFPNSLGALDYSGRLFRVDASLALGSQARSLTHCAAVTAGCPSVSTTSNSAPHADSRRLTFDAAGNLLESDDGGVYKRTNPQGVGDWFSLNGSLGIAEMHNVAYDRVSKMIIAGDQDTGTPEQTTVGGTTWKEVHSGDGGDVQVDDISSATQSIRYSSFQNLGNLRRRVMNTAGVATSTVLPARTVLGGGAAFSPQFVTPVEVNTIDATRVLFAGSNDLYESLDRGDTITALLLGKAAVAMVYGGSASGTPNAGLIYAINGQDVYVRTAASGPLTITPSSPVLAPTTLRDIAVDPTDFQKAWVITSNAKVFSTINAGGSWTDVTGNLSSGSSDLRSIVFAPGSPNTIVVGSGRPACPCPPAGSIFSMATNAAGVWSQLGTGLPNVPVWDLDYDPIDKVFVAGTLGRGAWSLPNPSVVTCTPTGGDTDNDGIPDTVEPGESTSPCVKDNDIFTSARLFAMQQYRDFLSREGDVGGIASWTASIGTGTTRASVVNSFFDSPEFQGAIAPVTRLYFAYFNRIPDKPGLDYWIGNYRLGMPLNTISLAFAGSPEFITTYGSLSNAAFVTLVYNNVLGRAPDAVGLAHWTGQLDGGFMTRGQVMVGFSESPEYQAGSYNRVFVTMIYYGMLRRVPEQAGFDFWVANLNAGVPTLNLINGFLTAPEYHGRFLP